MVTATPADEAPLSHFHGGWRIVPIAKAVSGYYVARYELHRAVQGGSPVPGTTWETPGEFATREEALAGAIAGAVNSIDTTPDWRLP